MDFNSALISMQHGHNVRRKHWKGYWYMKGNEIIMHCYNDASNTFSDIYLRYTSNMLYTVQNMMCNDWEIADCLNSSGELDFIAGNKINN